MIILAILVLALGIWSTILIMVSLAVGCDPFYMFRPKIKLTDNLGENYFSRIYVQNGGNYAYVYPFSKVGKIKLLDDGRTSSIDGASYIKTWERL